LKLNDRDNAKDAAELYLKFATSPDDRQRAQQVLDFLKQPAQVVPSQRDLDEGGRPRLARSSAPDDSAQSVSGSFVELDCGDVVRMVLETPAGKKTLVIEDPAKIVATGRADGVRLLCGPQEPVPVRVDYHSAGTVLAIHFDR
jgi:hypothetical protein